MIVENGKKYDSNYARAAAFFLGSCAPCPDGEAEKSAYKLITGIYQTIADDPAAIGYKPVQDVSFEPWEQQKGREKDIQYIRDAIKKIEAIISEFFNIMEAAEYKDGNVVLPEKYKIGRALKRILEFAGVKVTAGDGFTGLNLTKDCFDGLKELVIISNKHIIPITDGAPEDKAYLYFSRCVFEPARNWVAMAYDKVLKADGRLIQMCNELEKRGYKRIDCHDGKAVSLDYIKLHGKKDEKLKKAWGERVHSGISVTYEELRLEPCFIWIRMPMYRKVLECAECLPDDVRNFMSMWTKTCDGCRYCVQTDKTNTRPLANVEVDGRKKCSYYPGFSMNWRELNDELFKNMLALLDAIDSLPELNK